ncbi:MAG TPA: zinc metalloprotease [Deltaproteobacteria bacterium]|nr:zinc metalloprotease [Deltaproteobacteria bacterium]
MRNLIILLLAACAPKAPTAPAPAEPAEPVEAPVPERVLDTVSPDVWGEYGLDLTTGNPDVHPGDNFFMHVNGGWYDRFEMPADRSRYGSFDLLAEKSEQRVRWVIEDLAAAKPALDTPSGKVAAFYNAYMNIEAIEAAGLAPAQPYLDRIDAIDSREALATCFSQPGFASPFGGYVFVDDKAPDVNIMQFGLSGLGLPDRDYYLSDNESSKALRTAYITMLTAMFTAAGDEDAEAKAATVMALETKLAETHWDRTLLRNPEITYNKLSRDEFIALGGDFPVMSFLEGMGIAEEETFLVSLVPPTAEELAAAQISEEDAEKLGAGFPGAFALAHEASLDDWKTWLRVHFLIDHASVLPAAFDDATFALYGTAMRGQTEQRKRWKRAVRATEGAVGEAIGQVYVDRHFPPQAKVEMDALVANLSKAMALNLDELTWMGPETKVMAHAKLASFNPKVGYPKEFETYEGLTIGDNALENSIQNAAWSWEDNRSDLKKPVDRDQWFMNPQTVNAYYNPAFNEIVFPAAILDHPFFGMGSDPAVNYGAIGGVIGHEMGHGFDDQGAKYDAQGVLKNWWTDEDLAAFQALGDALVAQYDGYCPLDEGETCVNGRLTLGENIGDLGGLSLAYRAYKLSLDGKEDSVIDGLTGDQRFFMSWAQVWRSKYNEKALRQQLVTDPHSPALFRVNGIVRNLEAWYDAFGVTEAHALYLAPEDRIVIW